MNKKFLSAVLFGALMVGSSVTFTGCIDNDEPAGIENLRGAKAELLRAKVAVEAAEAARLNAEAARLLAVAEMKKADAAYRNAEAAMQQALADQEAARTEAEKARIEKEIAGYKLAMEKAALEHQKSMLTLQKDCAEAKSKYELLLKEIEIAQTLVTGEYKTELSTVKQDVEDAYDAIYAENGWADKVYDAEEKLYEAQLLKAQGGDEQKSWIPELELGVTRKEGALTAAETKVQMLKDFLEKDATTADWRKEIKTLEDSISNLELVISNYDVEKTKIEQSDEYLAAEKAQTDAQTALDGIKTSKYTYKYKYDETKSYGRKTFEIADQTAIKPGNKTEGAEFEVNNEIKGVEAQLAVYTTQKTAILDELVANQEALIKSTKEAYDDALKEWKAAKAKYDGVGAYDADKALKTIKKAGETYDAAITAANNIADPNLKAEAQTTARLAYAKALVTYYTEADKYVGCETNEVSLRVSSPAGTTENVKKTVLAWLSDVTYPATYLKMIIDEYSYTTASFYTEGSAIKKLGSKETLLDELKQVSSNAFGNALLKGKDYMYVEPTAEEVRAIENYSTECGIAGEYYYASDPLTIEEANNYKAIMADFEAALTSLKAKADAMAKAVADAKETLATKKAEFKVLEDKVEAVKTKQGIVTSSKNAIDEVRKELVKAAKAHLGLDDVSDFVDTKAFEKALQKAVEEAENAVIVAQKELAKAQADLKKAQEGKYDAVAEAQKELDEANAGLTEAQKVYETALANLKIALEIMAKSAE